MNTQMKAFLESRNCFKLICGANNENYEQITKLIALYSSAGCRFFDINASKEALIAAKKGLEYSKAKNCFICLSTGADDDPHLAKCKIIEKHCKLCKKCSLICPQNAIKEENKTIIIDEKKCIGCKICLKNCNFSAIETYQKKSKIELILPEIKTQCDCIELHIVSNNLDDVDKKWQYLCNNFDGFLSISVNCSLFSREVLIKQLKKMISKTNKNRIIIQADGSPMTGLDNDYRTSLQAVATADIIEKADLGVFIITSGGVNSKTKELLEKFNIQINGCAMGSYARKIVKDYIDCNDFLQNEEKFNKALKIAKELISKI